MPMPPGSTNESGTVTRELTGAVAVLTLDRPRRKGAFDWPMVEALAEALTAAQRDDAVRAVVLTGTGSGFCAGIDLTILDQVEDTTIAHKRMLTDRIYSIMRAALDLDKPLIAAVNGTAVGAGMDMALMCDIRFAGRSARFSEGYIRLGLLPGDGGAYFLPRLVGSAKALELLWTGDFLDADQAHQLGVVNRVCDDDILLDETIDFAQTLAEKSPIAIAAIKRAVYQSPRMGLRASLDSISSHMAVVMGTDDYREARRAFADSDPRPEFCDR